MSFKREGDDKSQLNILKKRRVADLLSNFIPEDEAALMKNGRYTCLVCYYRPVFDTVDMLTVHRQGKRHLEGLKAFYGKKAKLKNEITKRNHENYVKAEDRPQEPSTSAPLLVQTRKLTHHALLKTAPYNSCHTKTSTKSERGPASASSAPPGKICNKMASSCWKAGVSNNLSSNSSNSNADSGLSEDVSGPPAAGPPAAGPPAAGPPAAGPPAAGPPAAPVEPITAQRRRELEHYLKLKSDGWLQDRNGQWVKDENVEFDSDEEEPASLAPQPTSRSED